MATGNEDPSRAPDVKNTEEVLDFLANGGTIGDMAGFTANEYEAIYSIAYNFMQAQKTDKAVELLKFLVVNDPATARWYYALGVAEQARGDFPTALEAYSMAHILDVDDPLPQLQGGFCLMAMEKFGEAVEALEGAVECSENKPGFTDVCAQARSLLDTARGRRTQEKG